jgi:uncharacterized protein
MSKKSSPPVKAAVYFVPLVESSTPEQQAAAALKLWERMNLDSIIAKNSLVAIKQHFGEKGGVNFISPAVAKAVGAEVRRAGGKPFSTDSNTLYNGQRANAVDHLELARQHGFSHEALGFPVIIADGLKGESQVTLEGPAKALKHVFIAGAGYMADAAIMLTHVTGHLAAGMGAAIKNVAMGFGGRAGKLQQHHAAKPIFSAAKCQLCGRCVKHCPVGAIVLKGSAVLDQQRCIGCGECYAFCRHGAVGFDWSTTSKDLQHKMAEYCLAFHREKAGRAAYLNFITRVTKNCDCMGSSDEPHLPDLGVVGSMDPVAVDTASMDLLDEKHGRDVFAQLWPKCQHRTQLQYGQEIGLGSMQYELVRL